MTFQVLAEVGGRLIPPGGIGVEAFPDDRLHGRRDRRVVTSCLARPLLSPLDQLPNREDRSPRVECVGVVAGQEFEQDHPEREDVAPRVGLDGPPQEPLQVLGRHVGERAADGGRRGVGVSLDVLGEVEVQDQRLAVVGHQDVGRLQVAMEDAPPVGVRQAVGDPRADPEDGVDVGESAEGPEGIRLDGGGLAGRVGGGPRFGRGAGHRAGRAEVGVGGLLGRALGPRPLARPPGGQALDEDLAGVGEALPLLDVGEQVGQRRPAEEGHADRVERRGVVDREDRHDVGVLELGQRLRLAARLGRDLQSDQPIGQVLLPGQEDPAEGPSPQLFDEVEAEEDVPPLGHRDQAPGQPARLLGRGPMEVGEDLLGGRKAPVLGLPRPHEPVDRLGSGPEIGGGGRDQVDREPVDRGPFLGGCARRHPPCRRGLRHRLRVSGIRRRALRPRLGAVDAALDRPHADHRLACRGMEPPTVRAGPPLGRPVAEGRGRGEFVRRGRRAARIHRVAP